METESNYISSQTETNGFNASQAMYSPPDILLGDPASRPLKVIVAGCGVSGIMMAYKIQKSCRNTELVMYDKNADLGGTWYENRYPGCGCDIPVHAYSFNFALYPEWPQYCAYQKDIRAYLNRVSEVFNLRKYMHFEHRISRAEWVDKDGKWKVTVERRQHNGNWERFEDYCDVFLYATGVLNQIKWPSIKGLEKFQGRVFHSAQWPDDYTEEQWKTDRVAVVGSGASSIQIVSAIQPSVKSLNIFVRTGAWFAAIADNFGEYNSYPKEQVDLYRTDVKALVDHAKDIENKMIVAMDFQHADSDAAKGATEFFRQRMKEHIKDERLLQGFTPTWSLGCRRVTPADPYMRAIQQPNVHVHFAAAQELKENSIIDAKGEEVEVDTVICATGFDTDHRVRFPIVGKNGIELSTQWGDHPEAYLGLAVPNMPNFFTFMGPAYPVHNGSIMGPLTANGDYIIDVLNKMQRDHIKSLAPRSDVTDQFNEHVQQWIKRTVWTQDCRSWFKNNKTNRVTALWPGTGLHYREAIIKPRYEDFAIEYLHGNPWAILGNGYTWAEKTEGMDATPFLDVEALDPLWRKATMSEK